MAAKNYTKPQQVKEVDSKKANAALEKVRSRDAELLKRLAK